MAFGDFVRRFREPEPQILRQFEADIRVEWETTTATTNGPPQEAPVPLRGVENPSGLIDHWDISPNQVDEPVLKEPKNRPYKNEVYKIV